MSTTKRDAARRGHGKQPWRYGTESPLIRRLNAIGSRIEPHPSGCWLWTGARNESGYGTAPQGGPAHRVVYEILVGPIPRGRHLHHKCQVPRCVNPDHLEPVTPAEHGERHVEVRRSGQNPALNRLARALATPGAD